MKKLLTTFIGGITLMTLIYGCTENNKAKMWGGTETITLDPGKRLMNVTWKDKNGTSLWILTKQDTTKPTTYTFEEKSSFGVMEGKVIIKEQ
jgi:hypothetical protein